MGPSRSPVFECKLCMRHAGDSWGTEQGVRHAPWRQRRHGSRYVVAPHAAAAPVFRCLPQQPEPRASEAWSFVHGNVAKKTRANKGVRELTGQWHIDGGAAAGALAHVAGGAA